MQRPLLPAAAMIEAMLACTAILDHGAQQPLQVQQQPALLALSIVRPVLLLDVPSAAVLEVACDMGTGLVGLSVSHDTMPVVATGRLALPGVPAGQQEPGGALGVPGGWVSFGGETEARCILGAVATVAPSDRPDAVDGCTLPPPMLDSRCVAFDGLNSREKACRFSWMALDYGVRGF